ncbi:S49 family peptidase [Pacificitalea manganoxidans]|uniref:S49 family peptidase n=1 Tax=Pacificitalea manganoxidans TaxID=1411902 RepID=A0A291M1G5_9RHOB|nr:S49 family peptidase [Pacificitalea manganoxidans]MAQ46840.1 S49 family peptidase [Actibacterium sp.]OWU68857.1 multidrug transporter [Roseovarius sp. 22II1-1F6A]ATI42772.1 S49 family peptidase [Pacificitalea manganoxidans]MBF51394.1 S49 family peptidase [Actibacterium sp.]MDR6307327.1 serine protease SohB [Pacificitalea manganoxidans]
MKRFIPFVASDPVVAVLRLNGAIASGPRGLSDAGLAPLIEKAFRRGKPAAVALSINSPGGSPAQSSLIAARIRRLAEEKNIPVVAFVEDVAASGGYWLACAADEIIVDQTSILGSIGVISASFGLHEFLGRHGIERRVHTAGGSKSFLDPFRPENPDDVARLKRLQSAIHDSFIAHVKSRRGEKLDAQADLFTGDIWVGQGAIDVGLADGIGHLVPVMKQRFGAKTRFVSYGQKKGLLARVGMSLAADTLGHVEESALWARYGLQR